jgi:hypothetical protein
VDSIFETLEEGEWDGIARLFLPNGMTTRGQRDAFVRSFQSWQNDEANPDRANLSGSERNIDIFTINAMSPRSVEVTAYHTKVVNGITYWALLEWTLTKFDGEWYINLMPHNILSRSTGVWNRVD